MTSEIICWVSLRSTQPTRVCYGYFHKLIAVTGGAAAMLEPALLRSTAKRDTFAWKRGETTASAGELMAFNRLTAEALTKRAIALVH
ncbi:hypothetical protein [Nostoc sp. NOS(2021)]|uniref:hypothetical protein n=1 Tax=Nostoc sp. NOS(2021) TaxID=2815407 RepID=UPI0025EA642E|nr:hypothetical protein [Nostoc sp. NOS(2021)]